MFFKRLHEMRLAAMAVLLTALVFVFFGYLLITDLLTLELARGGAFLVWGGVLVLLLMQSEKGGGRPSVLCRDCNDKDVGAPGGCGPTGYLPPARSHRTFVSTIGGHVAGLVGRIRNLVMHGAGGRMRLQLARVST